MRKHCAGSGEADGTKRFCSAPTGRPVWPLLCTNMRDPKARGVLGSPPKGLTGWPAWLASSLCLAAPRLFRDGLIGHRLSRHGSSGQRWDLVALHAPESLVGSLYFEVRHWSSGPRHLEQSRRPGFESRMTRVGCQLGGEH